jgi:conjugative relaxase-like TrwC/TraI family protein
VLVAHREGLAERRAGWDVTISPHKSVSLAALVGGDTRLLEAHDRAVSKALLELERHVQAWVHGGREVETTGTVLAASFRHETSRALDPQLHSHCVVLNVTRRADGEWRAVEARGIFRAQRLAREIYEAELSRELRGLGYEVKTYRDGRSGRDRATGIAGFEPGHLKHFSKRSREIEKALQAGGLKSRLHGERVTLATRAVKAKGIDREALAWGWRAAAKEASLVFPASSHARAEEWTRAQSQLRDAAREAVDGAVKHLGERRSVFRVADLEREALSRGRERGVGIDDVRSEIGRRPDLVMDRGDATRAQATTSKAVADERALLDAAARGRGRGDVVAGVVERGRLGEDQVKVARHVLHSTDRLLAVEGKAGAGKTTLLEIVRERAEASGWRVRGFAPTTTAAGVLREGGIDAVTVAAALREPVSPANDRALWIVDEAGLLSTRQARELLDRAEQAGAKVVLVGDRAQHRAVEAGSPFALLLERGGIAVERLDVIRRQKDEALRETVRAASEAGGAGSAVRMLEEAGRVVEIEDLRARHERIVRDFVADGGRGVVIAPSNAERTDLNRRIREARIEAGQVERKSVKARVVVRQDLTAEQKRRAASYAEGDVLRFVRRGDGIEAGARARVVSVDETRNRLRVELRGQLRDIDPRERRAFEVERLEERRFAVGDRIQFRERDRRLDVANGTLGKVTRIDPGRGTLTVEVGSRRVKVDLEEPRALDHAYAVTSHRSQGLSRERVYLTVDTRLSEELVNRRQFYVSVSRAVQDARVYTDDRAALTRAVSREQARESALEVVERARGPEAGVRPSRPLDVAERSHGEPGHDRSDGRAQGADRRAEELGRGPEREARAAQGPARAERGRLEGADRVPGPGDAGAAHAGRAAGERPGRTGQPSEHAPERADRGSRVASGAERAAADGAPGRVGTRGADRDEPGELRGDARPLVEAGAGPERGGRRAGERAREEAPALSREDGRAPRRGAGAMTREEIAASPGLQRRYASEYREALKIVPDRELAKDVARVNLTAKERGERPLVTREVVARVGPAGVREAIARHAQDLGRLRTVLVPLRMLERTLEPLRGPER